MPFLVAPSCVITREELNGEDTLVCTGAGNPDDMEFEWSYASGNETSMQNQSAAITNGQQSFLSLNDVTVMRMYRCIATNDVGSGTMCEYEVAGKWFSILQYLNKKKFGCKKESINLFVSIK